MANSSLIARALYHPDRRELELLLHGGRRYVYSGVPGALAEDFRQAESKGRFYNARIRNCFPCREVGAAPRRRFG